MIRIVRRIFHKEKSKKGRYASINILGFRNVIELLYEKNFFAKK